MAAPDKSSLTFHFCIYDDALNGDIMAEIMILQTQCALVFPSTRDTKYGPERGFQMRAPRVGISRYAQERWREPVPDNNSQMLASPTSKRSREREEWAALLRVRTGPECPEGSLRKLA